MIVKQLYSIIHVDEAIQTMEAGANNIGLVPTQNGGVPATSGDAKEEDAILSL